MGCNRFGPHSHDHLFLPLPLARRSAPRTADAKLGSSPLQSKSITVAAASATRAFSENSVATVAPVLGLDRRAGASIPEAARQTLPLQVKRPKLRSSIAANSGLRPRYEKAIASIDGDDCVGHGHRGSSRGFTPS